MARQRKITLGEMREMSTRGLLVYCSDYRCSHSTELGTAEVGKWPDSVRLSDLEPRFVCGRRRKRGVNVRRNHAPTTMGSAARTYLAIRRIMVWAARLPLFFYFIEEEL